MDANGAVIVGTPRISTRLAARRQSLIEMNSLKNQCEQIPASGNGLTDSYNEHDIIKNIGLQSPATPKRRRRATCDSNLLDTPTNGEVHTPRRSTRKSIRPPQDYEEIVNSKVSRSLKKDLTKEVLTEEDDEEQEVKNDMRKWTPSKVGRGTVKRKSKRGRRATVTRKCLDHKEVINVDSEVLDVIANDEEENKENVEPEELRKNRKSPKESEIRNTSIRRSMDVLQESKIKAHLINQNESVCVEHKDNGEENREREENQDANEEQFSLSPKRKLESMDVLQESKIQTRGSRNNNESGCVELNKNNGDEKREREEIQEANETQESSPKRKSESFQLEEFDLVPIQLEENENVEQETEREENNETNSNLNSIRIDETIIVSPSEDEVQQKSLEVNHPIIPTIVLDTPQPSVALQDQSEVEVRENDAIADITSDIVGDSSVQNTQDSRLNTSDCIIISPLFETDKHLEDTANQKMGSEEEVEEIPNCELNNEEVVKTVVSSPIEDCNISKEPHPTNTSGDQQENRIEAPRIALNDKLLGGLETPKPVKKISIITPMVNSVKKITSKPIRGPTPYKSTLTNTGKDMDHDNNSTLHSLSSFNLTTVEPKEFVLRSIRKRSFSASIDRPIKKPSYRVKFNSPANQTTIIDDIDFLISKSAKKPCGDIRKQETSTLDTSKVTKRRKRSLSVDESMFSKCARGPVTPLKGSTTPQRLQAATKIPNFAAIHQRHFNRMESLIDHVARKADRAKQLLNSASKPRSAHKTSTNTQQNLKAKIVGTSATNVSKPRAIKPFDLTGCTMKPTTAISKNVERLPCPPQDGLSDDENLSNSAICNLPDPRMFKNIAIIQPVAVTKPAKANALKNVPKVMKPMLKDPHHSKPPFNLSTHLKGNNKLEAAATAPSLEKSNDKILERRQRHMNMFKGRIAGNREKDKSSGDIIQGVRSNRRFDLQMQHRKNLMQDNAKL